MVTIVGMVLLLWLVPGTTNVLTFVPGLFLVGFGVGVMLTSSVNVVQSSFPEDDQGEISGLSRSVSNLGSSLGVAIAGTVIVSTLVTGNEGYALALIVLAVFAVVGLVAAFLLPNKPVEPPATGNRLMTFIPQSTAIKVSKRIRIRIKIAPPTVVSRNAF